MIGNAFARAGAGEKVPGLIVTSNSQAIASAIEDILLIAETMTEEEMAARIVAFLPFRG